MKLNVKKTTRNKVVTIELYTFDFTEKENAMLDQLDEPVIEFEKTYGANVIKFTKRIRTGFKVRVKFDATLNNDIIDTADYVTDFLNEVREMLEDSMANLKMEFNDELKSSEDVYEIKY